MCREIFSERVRPAYKLEGGSGRLPYELGEGELQGNSHLVAGHDSCHAQ